MAIAPNDVNVLSVETADLDFAAGQDIEVTVEAEAGIALHGTGGTYRVRITMTDTTNPALLDQQNIVGQVARDQKPVRTGLLHHCDGRGKRDGLVTVALVDAGSHLSSTAVSWTA